MPNPVGLAEPWRPSGSSVAGFSSATVTLTVCSLPSRTIDSLVAVPGSSCDTSLRRSLPVRIDSPLTAVITSPRRTPALSAGLPASTEFTSAPRT